MAEKSATMAIFLGKQYLGQRDFRSTGHSDRGDRPNRGPHEITIRLVKPGEIEHSLTRLATDYIDLYQSHWPDSTTAIADTHAALLKLKDQGKIRAIGVSNLNLAQLRTYGKIDTAQEKFSMLDDHTPFLEAGISAVDIIDFDYPYWHTTEDTADKVSPESLQVVGDTMLAWLKSRK